MSGQDQQPYANSKPGRLVTGKQDDTAFYIGPLDAVCSRYSIQVLHLTVECSITAHMLV